MSLRSFFKRYKNSLRGATAIEYGLIAAGIALTIAAAVMAFGSAIYDLFYSELPGLFD